MCRKVSRLVSVLVGLEDSRCCKRDGMLVGVVGSRVDLRLSWTGHVKRMWCASCMVLQ
jgi:hypothetical protein